MKEITFKVNSVELLLTDGVDELFLHLDAPTTFPNANLPTTIQINTQQGYGETWAAANLGMSVKTIDVRTPKGIKLND